MPSSTLNGFPAIGTTPGAPAPPKLLRVITRCSTRPEFLSTFGRFVDETSIFVATHQPRPRGVTMPFAIALEDGEAMLRGEAEVIESHTEGDGSQRRPGMRLRILHLDGASRATHAELLARKRSSTVPPPVPPPVPGDAPSRSEKPVRASTSSTPVESRVPGSSYIVPANPFTELPPEALEYFVECTLYEETMDQPEAPDPLPPPPITPPHGSPAVAPSSSAEVPAVASSAPAIVPRTIEEPLAPARRSIAPVLTALIGAAIGLVGGFVMWGLRDESAPVAAPTAAPPPPTPTPTPTLTTPSNPTPDPPPTHPAPAATAPVTAAAPVTATAPVAATAPVTATAPAPPVAPAATDCRATVTTEPSDSLVRIDGTPAGRTPLAAVSVPCGPHVITIEHARYERVERHVVVTDTEETRLDVRLLRPAGLLELHSAPPGAIFTVDGTQAGRSPTTAHVPAYTFVRVRATLDGFGTWTQRVYVLGTKMSLTAPLEPGRRALKASTKPQL